MIESTCLERATLYNRSPTITAVLPLMPVSTSSNISVGVPSAPAQTVLIASITRESSPPEATFERGLSGSPLFADSMNSTSSLPFAWSFPSSGRNTMPNAAFAIPSSCNCSVILRHRSSAASLRFSVSFAAVLR